MFTVVRSEYIRHSLEIAISHWWERHELPSMTLLRDGLLLLEQGGELSEGQRAILLRAALSLGKGVRTALRHQANPERTAVLLNDALLMVNSRWSEEDLQQWMQKDPHVKQWRELLRTELLATNQLALPSQRRKIDALLEVMRDVEDDTYSVYATSHDDDWDLFAEAALIVSSQPVQPSKMRFLMATVLLLSLAIFFYQRYAPILGQSDMIEVTALLQPVPQLVFASPTATETPTPTETPTLPEISSQPESPMQLGNPAQPESPIQLGNSLQPASPLQPVSPLQAMSPLPTPSAVATPTALVIPATPSPIVAALPVPEPIFVLNAPIDAQPALRTFLLDRTEVTNVEYRKCVAAEKCPKPASGESATHKDYFLSAVYNEYPVVGLDLASANAYCAFRGKRLPAADEWETAASLAPATNRRYRYPWGDQFIAQYVNSAESEHGDTTIVGAYRPRGSSPLGLDDMAGNVAEWTATIVVEEGVGKAVVKGGSYRDPENSLLADSFQLVDARHAEPWIGFRCAR